MNEMPSRTTNMKKCDVCNENIIEKIIQKF